MPIEHDVTIITCSVSSNDGLVASDESRSKEKKILFLAAILLYGVLGSALLQDNFSNTLLISTFHEQGHHNRLLTGFCCAASSFACYVKAPFRISNMQFLL